MCGITGWLYPPGREPTPDPLARMAQAIRHRGPDDEGFFRDVYFDAARAGQPWPGAISIYRHLAWRLLQLELWAPWYLKSAAP